MTHPLVLQLRFTRAEFARGLKGVTAEEALRHFGPMNCISWMAVSYTHLDVYKRQEQHRGDHRLQREDRANQSDHPRPYAQPVFRLHRVGHLAWLRLVFRPAT